MHTHTHTLKVARMLAFEVHKGHTIHVHGINITEHINTGDTLMSGRRLHSDEQQARLSQGNPIIQGEIGYKSLNKITHRVLFR